MALCGTQIWWTTEVNIAFNRLEEGYENALKEYNRKQVNLLFDMQLLILVFRLCRPKHKDVVVWWQGAAPMSCGICPLGLSS